MNPLSSPNSKNNALPAEAAPVLASIFNELDAAALYTQSLVKQNLNRWQEPPPQSTVPNSWLSQRAQNCKGPGPVYSFYDHERTVLRALPLFQGGEGLGCSIHEYRRLVFEGNGLSEESARQVRRIFFEGASGRLTVEVSPVSVVDEVPEFFSLEPRSNGKNSVWINPVRATLQPAGDSQEIVISDTDLRKQCAKQIIDAWNMLSLAADREIDSSATLPEQTEPQDPLFHLFDIVSCAPDRHYFGSGDALRGLCDYLEKRRTVESPLVDQAQMKARYNFMRSYAEEVLECMGSHTAYSAQAVVFFGSYVRGKQVPGDVDAYVMLPWAEPHYVDDLLRGVNGDEEAALLVLRALEAQQSIPITCDESGHAIPIRTSTTSQLSDGKRLGTLERSPILVFTKGIEDVPEVFFGYRSALEEPK